MPFQVQFNQNAIQRFGEFENRYRRFRENAVSIIDTLKRNPCDSNYCQQIDKSRNLWISSFFDPPTKDKIVFCYLVNPPNHPPNTVLILDIRSV